MLLLEVSLISEQYFPLKTKKRKYIESQKLRKKVLETNPTTLSFPGFNSHQAASAFYLVRKVRSMPGGC
jgi:hypothetical protein